MTKSTTELMKILEHTKTLESYLVDEGGSLIKTTLPDELSRLLSEKKMKPAELFRLSGIEKSYGYDILSGAKHPVRDKVLCMIFGLSLSIEEAQTLLKATSYAPLYPKNLRDSVIIYALVHRMDLFDTNETLYDMDLPLIK